MLRLRLAFLGRHSSPEGAILGVGFAHTHRELRSRTLAFLSESFSWVSGFALQLSGDCAPNPAFLSESSSWVRASPCTYWGCAPNPAFLSESFCWSMASPTPSGSCAPELLLSSPKVFRGKGFALHLSWLPPRTLASNNKKDIPKNPRFFMDVFSVIIFTSECPVSPRDHRPSPEHQDNFRNLPQHPQERNKPPRQPECRECRCPKYLRCTLKSQLHQASI